jgi:hypothetical protein
MSTNRGTLERLLRSGEIALERSPFLDQEPAPLDGRAGWNGDTPRERAAQGSSERASVHDSLGSFLDERHP